MSRATTHVRATPRYPRAMSFSPRARFVACLLVAVLAGGVATWHVAPLGPWLDIDVLHRFHDDAQDVYEVRVVPRGGEVIDEVKVEVLRGSARIVPPGSTQQLAPDTRFQTRVSVLAATPVPAAVRVTQIGRIQRTYDVEIAEVAR